MNRIAGNRLMLLTATLLVLGGITTASGQTTLNVSTYYGGLSVDGNADIPIVQAPDGTIYVAANTASYNIPVMPDAYQTSIAGSEDVVIARFNSDLTELLSATFLGGTGDDATDPGVDLAVAADGSVYVLSASFSSNWPVTAGAYQSARAGGSDLVLSHLSPGLDQLLASTYLGGTSYEEFGKLACLPGGGLMIICSTTSSNYPTTSGAFRELRPGGRDLALSRLDADLTTLIASTFIGSSSDDWPEALELDPEGNAYFTGWTLSSTYPVSAGAYQISSIGTYHAFVSRMSNDLTTLQGSTFIGGSAWEFGYGLAIDTSGDVFACGHTASLNFPVSDGCYQPAHGGTGQQGKDDDMWISRFDPYLTELKASTYLGGTGWENGYALVPTSSSLIVGGTTSSQNWPVTDGAIDAVPSGGSTFYTSELGMAVMDKNLTAVSAATYLGENGNESLGSMRPAPDGGIWLACGTSSGNLAVNPEAYDPTHNGGYNVYGGDLFLARLGGDLGALGASAAPLPRFGSLLSVMGACPNPFNPSTEVAFFLGADLDLTISVHDTAGRRIAVLADEAFPAGHNSVAWTGLDSAGRGVPSGVYLARIEGHDVSESVKLMLVK